MSTMSLKIENPGSPELRKFGLISGVIVAVLFGLLLPWIFDYSWPIWPWVLSGVLWLWALLHPYSLFVVYRPWLQFGHVAGWINSRIILAIMFYLLFFPVGMILRILRKDPMARKLDKSSNSYRIESQPLEKDHLERPY